MSAKVHSPHDHHGSLALDSFLKVSNTTAHDEYIEKSFGFERIIFPYKACAPKGHRLALQLLTFIFRYNIT